MKFDHNHASTLSDIMTWRRDVRHFKPDPVAEALLEQLQNAMNLAPSVGNARPWRILRVCAAEKRAAVKRIFLECNGQAANVYEGAKKTDYLGLKLAGLDNAPEHLAVFTDTAPPEGSGLGRQTMPETLQQSTAMAVHTLWLAARAENIGLGMVSILDKSAIEALFEVPDHWQFSAYLCLGYPEFEDDTPLLHREDWQENTSTKWRDV